MQLWSEASPNKQTKDKGFQVPEYTVNLPHVTTATPGITSTLSCLDLCVMVMLNGFWLCSVDYLKTRSSFYFPSVKMALKAWAKLSQWLRRNKLHVTVLYQKPPTLYVSALRAGPEGEPTVFHLHIGHLIIMPMPYVQQTLLQHSLWFWKWSLQTVHTCHFTVGD